jgi:alpha-L-fucosidase
MPVAFNVIRLHECIRLGERVESLEIDARSGRAWRKVAAAMSVGNCRLVRTGESVTTENLRLRITSSPVCSALSDFGLFAE